MKQKCGPSCTCVNCTNTSKKEELQEDRREEFLMESEDENSSSDEDDEMENEVRINQDNDDQDNLNRYYEELNEEVDLMIDDMFGNYFDFNIIMHIRSPSKNCLIIQPHHVIQTSL